MSIHKHEVNLHMLKAIGDSLAIRFLCPIYLVGSCIDRPETAKDIDIIMVVDENRFARLFHTSHLSDFSVRQYEFQAKQKLYAEQLMPEWDIDFKVQLDYDFLFQSAPRVKLDQFCPEPSNELLSE